MHSGKSLVISNKMEQIWPPKSPDMSPLDYWFLSACDQHMKESKPQNIDELVDHVSEYFFALRHIDLFHILSNYIIQF